jgi:glycosyltransferase involved in cell wall biosynthesis
VKKILQIGNWPPPVCGWAMSLVGLRRELEARGWDCPVMNLNENRKVPSTEYIDVQNAADYLFKVWKHVWRGYAIHVRVNGETKKGYLLALVALGLARLTGRPGLLTYCGGHQQSFFPAPKYSLRYFAFALLFRVPTRIYCNSEPVKQTLLTTRIDPRRVLPIPHFSTQYVQFTPVALPENVRVFCVNLDGIFFAYLCYRKEYMLEFLAEAMRSFRSHFPRIGFLLVGTSDRELEPLRQFFKNEKLEDAVCITGSVAHDVFLSMLTQSLACIRVPMTDGVSSSVMEALALRVPVLASDNGTRPAGVELWRQDDPDSLLKLMIEAVRNHSAMVARMPELLAEDNTKKLADDIERICDRQSESKMAGREGAVTGS